MLVFTASSSAIIECSHRVFCTRSIIKCWKVGRSYIACSIAAEIRNGFEGPLNKRANKAPEPTTTSVMPCDCTYDGMPKSECSTYSCTSHARRGRGSIFDVRQKI